MSRNEWRNDGPDLSVTSLTERESPISAHFSLPEVQCVGSTSQCGCDFPHVMFQNGDWPWFEAADEDEIDRQQKANDQYNREGLVALLRQSGDSVVELYGVWDGRFDFKTPPAAREHIHLESILDPAFRFKEQVFYMVRLR